MCVCVSACLVSLIVYMCSDVYMFVYMCTCLCTRVHVHGLTVMLLSSAHPRYKGPLP